MTVLFQPVTTHMPVTLKTHTGIKGAQVPHRRIRLRIPHVSLAMQQLALQVRDLNDVRITDADRSYARRRQIQENG